MSLPGFRYARQPQRSAWTLWRRIGSPRLSRMDPTVLHQAKRMWRGLTVTVEMTPRASKRPSMGGR